MDIYCYNKVMCAFYTFIQVYVILTINDHIHIRVCLFNSVI